MPSDFIRDLDIKECTECGQIRQLQGRNDINVAPLFWQGMGIENIPLVIMGINPSVVGTPNEPQRGCDFEYYFDYYQNRPKSEQKNRLQAIEQGITIPVKYWTICHNIANYCIEGGTPRWENYVLMEVIHCFFNKETDLTRDERLKVAQTCLDKHTCKLLMFLKPQMIVLLGETPYNALKKYLCNQTNPVDPIGKHCFYVIEIECQSASGINSIRVPVLRHPHPNKRGGPYLNNEVYTAYKTFCSTFDHET